MEPAIESIATVTGSSMEEIVRVLLKHAGSVRPLVPSLDGPRMPDLHLARYTIDIELKRAVEESVDDVSEKLASYAIEAALQDSVDEIGNAALKRLSPSVPEQVTSHYHGERNHQGLGNDLIAPEPRQRHPARVRCRERLGGLLRYYYRAA